MHGGTENPSQPFWTGKRVLVVGNTGFKGSWLSLWLHRLGASVVGLSLPPPTEPSLFALAGLADLVPTSYGDIRDLGVVTSAVSEAQPEIVFHLAAQSLVRMSYHQPVETYATNVMGTVHVLEASARCSTVRAVVVVTSDKCYENREWPWAYRETEAMGGHDPVQQFQGLRRTGDGRVPALVLLRSTSHGAVGVATARAGNVIGGGDWAEDRLLPDCIKALGHGRPSRSAIRTPCVRGSTCWNRCAATCCWPNGWMRTPLASARPGTSGRPMRMRGRSDGSPRASCEQWGDGATLAPRDRPMRRMRAACAEGRCLAAPACGSAGRRGCGSRMRWPGRSIGTAALPRASRHWR